MSDYRQVETLRKKFTRQQIEASVQEANQDIAAIRRDRRVIVDDAELQALYDLGRTKQILEVALCQPCKDDLSANTASQSQ